jgi:hypothetical protein
MKFGGKETALAYLRLSKKTTESRKVEGVISDSLYFLLKAKKQRSVF